MPLGPRTIEVSSEVAQLRQLTEIGRALTYTTSLDQVAQLVVERGAELLEAPAAVLMLADGAGLLQVRASHGVADERVTRFHAPLDDDTLERIKGLFAVRDDRFVAVPLVVGGSVTGLVAVALAEAPTESDEWLLSALADQAAVALDAARLSGEVRLEMEGRLLASEGATNAKDRALATLAHDIRSPLGAIDGYCWNLEDGLYGEVNDRQRQALGRVRMSGQHLLSLLDSVMDMARLNAGVLPIVAEPVPCCRVATEAIDILTPAATAKLQTLMLAEGAPELIVSGNAARLRQVLVNLIGNAVKFTPERGSITVGTQLEQDRSGRWGAIRVTDSGPGIPDAERAAIFEPYYRSEKAAALPGVGLGLAISHALIEQMGGSLQVESELGSGSTFIVRLPLHSGSDTR